MIGFKCPRCGATINVRPLEVIEVIVLEDAVKPCETYCHACKQLRLWAKRERPAACGNCGSASIEVDVVGSEHFSRLKGFAGDVSRHEGPYPHEGACAGCRTAHVCNVCGSSYDGHGAGHCTNGRCSACHNAHCTSGGDTYPGHGFGTIGRDRT
jgi:hypothetical protein